MKEISLLSTKCVCGQFLADKFIPTITKVHASAGGTSLRHGAKVIGGHLLLSPGHSLSLPGDLASLPGDLPSLPGHFPGFWAISETFANCNCSHHGNCLDELISQKWPVDIFLLNKQIFSLKRI